MRFSSTYIPTLKESPSEAEVVSHKLLLRAGMVRKLTSGVYIYLPLGLKALENVQRVVREEMDAAGFSELLMVIPGDLWKETGRWEYYGKELLRFKDRNDRDYCLGPTHEEVITDLVRGEVRSYRQLPVRLYQIQTKFRDEIRPRFGLMRGREFVMKDAYSFDSSDAGADESYKLMYDAYCRIFKRLGLRFRAVEADTGSIGGNFSHEFMVLADTGEDTIAACTECSYAANVERAEVVWNGIPCTETCAPYEKVATPAAHTVEEVSAMLKVAPSQVVKTMLFVVDGKTVAEPDRYALAVFPAAWDATQAPAALRAPGTDFWVALGYDFVRFAVRMAFDSRPPAATVNAQAANMKIQWAMAPLSWDEKGIAHQKLHLFQPGANGMEPLDLTRFRNMREAILQRAALRMQGLPTVDEQGNSLIPGLPGMSAGPAVLNTPAATSPTPGVAPLSTTPQPSYKLRLSPATTGTTRTAR